ncbi:crossover junction endonuclease EME1-like isoform X2 [Oscarella lobularis]|uniref:crossover junction endonuclease EME1-like isoform X2 n=1 Tax=Oscarella lobularis TaxID=121494 RepID=UPI003313AA32
MEENSSDIEDIPLAVRLSSKRSHRNVEPSEISGANPSRRLLEEGEEILPKKKRRKRKEKDTDAASEDKPPEKWKQAATLLYHPDITALSCASELFELLTKSGLVHKPHSHPIQKSITWRSTETKPSLLNEVRDNMIVIITCSELEALLKSGSSSLAKYAEDVVSQSGGGAGTKCTFLIEGSSKHLRSIQTQVNRDYRNIVESGTGGNSRKRKQIVSSTNRFSESDVIQASINFNSLGYQCWVLDSAQEIAELLVMTTKAIFDKHASSRCGFVEFVSNKFSRKNKDDFLSLWKSQLCQFPTVSANCAEAIASEYPSPYRLHQAYRSEGSPNGASELLQNVMVRRGAGVAETTRRVGKKISQWIHCSLTSMDPLQYIN